MIEPRPGYLIETEAGGIEAVGRVGKYSAEQIHTKDISFGEAKIEWMHDKDAPADSLWFKYWYVAARLWKLTPWERMAVGSMLRGGAYPDSLVKTMELHR